MPMPKSGVRPVNIRNSVYTMATVDGNSAEIIMYGDIYESRPVDWWTGEPVEGQFILLDEFLEDLQKVAGCKYLTIKLNSYGGDAGVSNTIHNRLRELARDGVNITCVVDGVAMSGGSIIMCAADTVRVNPSSLIMIHKAASVLWGGYNADELRDQAGVLDAWDNMQVEVYKRKTGLSETVIRHMMSDTTYMTGREAVEKGFADEVLEDAEPLEIAASADGRSIFVRGKETRLAPGLFAPESIPTVKTGNAPPVEAKKNKPDATGKEGGNSMTAEELRREHPDAVAEIEAAARAGVTAPAGQSGSAQETTNPQTGDSAAQAASAERERIKAIDEIAGAIDPALVEEAKYGVNACTAAELALRAVKAASKSGQTFLAGMEKDAAASGTAQVSAATDGDPNQANHEPKTPEEKLSQARAQVAALFGGKEAK